MLRCFILKDNIYLADSHSLVWQKALKAIHKTDPKLEYFRKKMLEALEAQEKGERLQKAGFPIGTIREWRGKKFIKIAPNKWRPKYDAHTRGAKLAIRAIKRKVDLATSSEELLQITLGNSSRFRDSDGHLLPFVEELRDYISTRNLEIESGKGSNGGNGTGGGDGGNGDAQQQVEQALKNNAIDFVAGSGTKERYIELFKNGVETPIGKVKMGEHQYEKFVEKNRTDIIESAYTTLKEPVAIIKDDDTKVFVKSFIKDNKQKNIVSVVISKDGNAISISTHQRRIGQIVNKIKKGEDVIYITDTLHHGTVRTNGVADVGNPTNSIINDSKEMSREKGQTVKEFPFVDKFYEKLDAVNEELKPVKWFYYNYKDTHWGWIKGRFKNIDDELGVAKRKIDRLNKKKMRIILEGIHKVARSLKPQDITNEFCDRHLDYSPKNIENINHFVISGVGEFLRTLNKKAKFVQYEDGFYRPDTVWDAALDYINSKPIINKDFLKMTAQEKKQFAQDAKTKYAYFTRNGVHVACGKEKDKKKFRVEMKACKKLAEYGHDVYLLPESCAMDSSGNPKTRADTITDDRTLELKETNTNVQRNYQKAKHQATDVFIDIKGDISKDKAIKEIERAIRVVKQNNTNNVDFEGKVYINNKEGLTLLDIDKDGNYKESNPQKK